MKKSLLLYAFMLISLVSFDAKAQKFPPLDKSPLDVASFPNDYKIPAKIVKIFYSRPQLKGRSLIELTPNGKVWRTGANEANEIIFYKDVMFGKAKIKAGSYSLYTIPGEKEWTIILSKDFNAWGAYSYKEADDFARLTVPVKQDTESLDAFSMVFTESGNQIILNMGWDTMRVAVPFTK